MSSTSAPGYHVMVPFITTFRSVQVYIYHSTCIVLPISLFLLFSIHPKGEEHIELSTDAPIIGIGRLSAVLPIIGIGRLLRRYRPIIVYALVVFDGVKTSRMLSCQAVTIGRDVRGVASLAWGGVRSTGGDWSVIDHAAQPLPMPPLSPPRTCPSSMLNYTV